MAVEKARMPPEIHDRPILRRKIWDRMHKEDKNYMAMVCGDTGSGKSEFAMRLCELIDPNFSEEQIVFKIDDFLRLVNDRSYPEGSMIMFDEVGVALDASTHYDQDQLAVNHILETWREQNRGLIMTAPHIGLLQKKSRGLIHAQMDMQGINREYWLSRARYRNIQQNTDNGDLYKKYPRLRDPETGRTRKYKFLKLYKPSPDLVKPYLKQKKEFNDQLNEDVLDQVTPDEEVESRTPKDIAKELLETGKAEAVVSKHPQNNTHYIDADLIEMDYNLSIRDAKKVKKKIESEVDPAELADAEQREHTG